MNTKKRLITIFVMVTMFVSLFASTGFASTSSVFEEKTLQQETFEQIGILDNYLSKNDKGILVLDEKVKEEVTTEVYEYFLNGVELLNLAAKEEKLSFDDNYGFVIHEELETKSNSNSLEPLDLSWTAYTFTYNYSEARTLQYALEDSASAWALTAALLAGISATVPNPTTIAAAASAAIMAVGDDWVATRINRSITSAGATIRVQWLPYPAVLVRGR
ncbi:hypothetical protein Amet_4690 [Alkaliphilus metalliredigens QYMF]|uniref:Uncharacterized protein n=1 Tax=Alkaliphilus metalliredigens (strain QYMF) TaxID=293826 RepID=A6TX40_ALKMQ|nr:hypothetical protein [Alkaliphilus metalliredigens]ABR50758.1 hypothetical protein Amet_4690 [Alkaliphilus metalliredigens QYMF]